MRLPVGSQVLVACDVSGPQVWPEGLVRNACRTEGWYAVLTISGNPLVGQMSDDSLGLLAERPPGRDGSLADRILRGRSYPFEAQASGMLLERLVERGRKDGEDHDSFAAEMVPAAPSADELARGSRAASPPLVLVQYPPAQEELIWALGEDVRELVKGWGVALPLDAKGAGGDGFGPWAPELPGPGPAFYRARPAEEVPVRGRYANAQGDSRTIPERYDASREVPGGPPRRFSIERAADLPRLPQVPGRRRPKARDVAPPLAERQASVGGRQGGLRG